MSGSCSLVFIAVLVLSTFGVPLKPDDLDTQDENDEIFAAPVSVKPSDISNANHNPASDESSGKQMKTTLLPKKLVKNLRKTLSTNKVHKVVISDEGKSQPAQADQAPAKTKTDEREKLRFDLSLERKMQNEKEDMELQAKMEVEIESFNQVKNRIEFLEEHLKKHADFHVIDTKDLVNAAKTLEEIKNKVVQPLELNLLAVRDNMKKMKYALTSKDREFVHTVLENAEAFLKLSNERIENFEAVEQDWDSEEEREKIRLAVAKTINENIQDTGLRSQRLQKVKDLVKAKKMKLKKNRLEESDPYETTEKKEEIKIDIHRLRQELERERMLDTEPGYGNKIKAALKDAAEKSHKFIHDKLSHGDHGTEEISTGSSTWIIAMIITATCCTLMLFFVFLLLKRGHNKNLRRKLFQGNESTAGYCELDDVRGDGPQTGLNNSSWNDSAWRSWNSQKLK